MDFEQRYRLEKEFHDMKAGNNARTDFYACGVLNRADRYAYDLLGDLQGKVLLDLGSGGGQHAVRFAEGGAMVYAVDLSPGMVEKSKGRVKDRGLDERVKVLQMSAEECSLPMRPLTSCSATQFYTTLTLS